VHVSTQKHNEKTSELEEKVSEEYTPKFHLIYSRWHGKSRLFFTSEL